MAKVMRKAGMIFYEFTVGAIILSAVILFFLTLATRPIVSLYIFATIASLLLSWAVGYVTLLNIKEKISQRKEKKNA